MSFSDPQHNVEQLGLTEGMKVADLGSGSGFYSIAAAGLVGTSGQVYAVDVQESLLTQLKAQALAANINTIQVLRGDLEHAGGSQLRDAFVDVVIVANVLFQVERKEALLHEAYRISKPGGRLLCVDWSDSFGGVGPQSEMIVSAQVAREYVAGALFTFERDIQAGAHHYGFIARKPK